MTSPKIYGLIGYPVKHSLSPAMHNAAFRDLNIDAEYRLFEVNPQGLEDFLLKNITVRDTKGKSFSSQDIAGFNITIPHKIRAREILEKKFPYEEGPGQIQKNAYYVTLSGAINTVKRSGNRLEYWNTDATGFFRSLTSREPFCLDFDPKGKNVLIIGCGGAGRAIIASLSWKNVGVKKIYINDISSEAVEATKQYFRQSPQYPDLEKLLEFISVEQIDKQIKEFDLLVNTTPLGLKEGDPSPVKKSTLKKNPKLLVYDGVYHRETQLIRDAKFLGLAAVDGLGMLLYQGVDAFELWTGKKPSVELMHRALIEAMSG